jgi:hypothetical protein
MFNEEVLHWKDEDSTSLLYDSEKEDTSSEKVGTQGVSNWSGLPQPVSGESQTDKEWFEKWFFQQIAVRELLPLASSARKEKDKQTHSCQFGGRTLTSENVVFDIIFDDGVEWVVKLPQSAVCYDEEIDDYETCLISECATLLFLEDMEVPTPKVYGFSFHYGRPVNSPYIFMNKITGVSLFQAVHDQLSQKCIRETVRSLAKIQKHLRNWPFSKIGSLTVLNEPVQRYSVRLPVRLQKRKGRFKGHLLNCGGGTLFQLGLILHTPVTGPVVIFAKME